MLRRHPDLQDRIELVESGLAEAEQVEHPEMVGRSGVARGGERLPGLARPLVSRVFRILRGDRFVVNREGGEVRLAHLGGTAAISASGRTCARRYSSSTVESSSPAPAPPHQRSDPSTAANAHPDDFPIIAFISAEHAPIQVRPANTPPEESRTGKANCTRGRDRPHTSPRARQPAPTPYSAEATEVLGEFTGHDGLLQVPREAFRAG